MVTMDTPMREYSHRVGHSPFQFHLLQSGSDMLSRWSPVLWSVKRGRLCGDWMEVYKMTWRCVVEYQFKTCYVLLCRGTFV